MSTLPALPHMYLLVLGKTEDHESCHDRSHFSRTCFHVNKEHILSSAKEKAGITGKGIEVVTHSLRGLMNSDD